MVQILWTSVDPLATGGNKIFRHQWICESGNNGWIDEFIAAPKSCKNRKSPCTDGLNFEPLNYAARTFLNFINLCWTNGHIAENWQMAKIVPILKRGDLNICDDYRGVSLLNASYKQYASILPRWLNAVTKTTLCEL